MFPPSGILSAITFGTLCLLPLGASSVEPDPASGVLVPSLMQMSDNARTQLGLSLAPSQDALSILEKWTWRAREACAGQDPEDAAGTLARFVFEDLEVVREVDSDELRFVFLPQVLTRRRGSCVGLVSLYLALAGRVELPACAVLAPGHLFVRVGPQGDRRNVELLRRGEIMDDDWYRRTYGVPDGVGAYLRCLAPGEFLAVVRYNLADELRARGRLADALPIWNSVVAQFPDFPEARANLGLAHLRLGDLESARAAYLAALRLHPDLPGLLHNLVLVMLEDSYFRGILGLYGGSVPAAMRP